MNASTALVPVSKRPTNGLAGSRQAPRHRHPDAALARAASQYSLEALESRRLLSGGFGDKGWTHASFGAYTGGAVGWPTFISADAAGKIYVGGEVMGGQLGSLGLARFNADGSPDASFGSDGSGTVTVQLDDSNAMVDRILPQPDGKVIVTAESADGIAVMRLNADGSVDTSFGGGPRTYDIFNGFPYEYVTEEDAAWVTSAGQVMISAMKGPDVVTLRLTADGHPDASFAPNGYVSATLDAAGDPESSDTLLAAQPLADGGVIAYADLYSTAWVPQIVQVRLDAGGNIVSTKAVDTTLTPGDGSDIGADPDYVVLFNPDGSAFVTSEGPDPRVAKLTASGDLDPAFGNGGLATVPGTYAQVLAVTPSGGAIVESGSDNTYQAGALDPNVRVDADGSLDAAFDSGVIAATSAYPAYALPDGSVLFTYTGGGYSHGGSPLGASFVLQKVSSPSDASASDGDGSATNDPAALEVIARVRAGDSNPFAGIFSTPDGSTIWNPAGNASVFDGGDASTS